jgi:hypothetical protein
VKENDLPLINVKCLEMEDNMFLLVKKFVIKSFKENNHIGTIKHLQRTVHWVKFLYPTAKETLLIAAISHDIDRAFWSPEENKWFDKIKKRFVSPTYLKYHQNKAAKIIQEFLNKNNIEKEKIKDIIGLIKKHEVGGTFEQNVLKDADSLSFFETNRKFIKMAKDGEDKKAIKTKINWMYNRITSRKAKQIALPRYTKLLNKLSKL